VYIVGYGSDIVVVAAVVVSIVDSAVLSVSAVVSVSPASDVEMVGDVPVVVVVVVDVVVPSIDIVGTSVAGGVEDELEECTTANTRMPNRTRPAAPAANTAPGCSYQASRSTDFDSRAALTVGGK
jgi:hypothetical protein